jgi:PAS domain S-box-containing protein
VIDDDAKVRLLATLVRDSNDAITVQDFEGNILEWNKGAEKMYGWSEAEALRLNIREIVPPDKSNEALLIIKKISEGKEVKTFETKRITADGRILDVWLTATALLNDEGVPVAVATTERDITDRKQEEKEKVELIKKLQKALAEVKTLRGIIPICMICKQIRDDKGYWEEVEVYVHKHSEAEFSHGICPNCLKTKFPKIYEKNEKKLLETPR